MNLSFIFIAKGGTKMADIKFEIKDKLGVISESPKAGQKNLILLVGMENRLNTI